MKKLLTVTLLILVASIGLKLGTTIQEPQVLGGGSGTINQLSQFKATSTPFSAITTNVAGKDIYIPASSGTSSDWTADQFCLTGDSCITTWSAGSGLVSNQFSATSPIAVATTSSNVTYSVATGFTIPVTGSTTEWTTAYGWGNHASAGYLTALTPWASDILASSYNLYGIGTATGTSAVFADYTGDSFNVTEGGSVTFTTATNETSISSPADGQIAISEPNSGWSAILDSSLTTEDRIYKFPDYSGTLLTALTPWTSDILASSYNLYGIGTATGTNAIFGSFTGYFNGNLNGTASSSQDVTCTDCLNATEIEDIYVLNTSDTMSGTLGVIGHTTLSTASSTVLTVSTAIDLMGEYITNFTTYVRSLFTGGDHITITSGSIAVDDDFLLNNGDTGTGTYDMSGATIKQEDSTGFLVASSSPFVSSDGFDSGDQIEIYKDFTIARAVISMSCKVVGGTSIVVFLTDGTNDTETLTCTTSGAEDTAVTTNDTFTADEAWYLEMGTVTGDVDKLYFEVVYDKN